MVLLDTCALIWYTRDNENLSKKAQQACNKIPKNGAIISSISIWEIGIKIKNKKLDIGITVEDFVQRLKKLGSIDIIPVDENIWMKSISLDWDHKDPADRAIIATAELNDIPIITSDKIISDFYSKIIW
ncbi:MAG: type II toxin-antitoxin system VapC family toxin [Planctomycetota bacterium]|jgi:PIN domain nuclease of toxin-antitoxin system